MIIRGHCQKTLRLTIRSERGHHPKMGISIHIVRRKGQEQGRLRLVTRRAGRLQRPNAKEREGKERERYTQREREQQEAQGKSNKFNDISGKMGLAGWSRETGSSQHARFAWRFLAAPSQELPLPGPCLCLFSRHLDLPWQTCQQIWIGMSLDFFLVLFSYD